MYEALQLGDGGEDPLRALADLSLHSRRAPGFPVATIAASSRTSTPTSLFRAAAVQADPGAFQPSHAASS